MAGKKLGQTVGRAATKTLEVDEDKPPAQLPSGAPDAQYGPEDFEF